MLELGQLDGRSSLLGIALANFIPTNMGPWALQAFCVYWEFNVHLATTRLRMVSSAVAGIAAVMAYALPLKLNIVVAIAVQRLSCV